MKNSDSLGVCMCVCVHVFVQEDYYRSEEKKTVDKDDFIQLELFKRNILVYGQQENKKGEMLETRKTTEGYSGNKSIVLGGSECDPVIPLHHYLILHFPSPLFFPLHPGFYAATESSRA